jgi:glycerol-3-phosphate dehydrogenase (NAD(P)+)
MFPLIRVVHLSGPNLALEIMEGKPTAAVAAGSLEAARVVQQQLMCPQFRVYTVDDEIGVEVAGFYKNIIAIAAGAVTELGLGENTRAVLITRALAEMGRLVDYFGGERSVLYGLAGIGDLIATCSSSKSRNFQVGTRLARGESLETILATMKQVAEGVQACEALHLWPREHPETLSGDGEWPDLPIAEQVYRLVHEAADPQSAIEALMSRPAKAEHQ